MDPPPSSSTPGPAAHPQAARPFIEVRGVHKAFGSQQVLRGISLDLHRGETLTIIGTSGGGKSVFLKHLVGLLRPDRGTILVDGVDISSLGERGLAPIRRKVGILFQGGALFDSLTVAQNVAFPLRERGVRDEAEIDRRVRAALEVVGLGEHLSKMPESLSGGMRKRAALARAIIAEPDCILYDEPTAGLDPIACNTIDRLVTHLQSSTGVTSVVITHNMRSVERISDRVAYIHEGTLYFLGTVEELLASRDDVIVDFVEGRSREIANLR